MNPVFNLRWQEIVLSFDYLAENRFGSTFESSNEHKWIEYDVIIDGLSKIMHLKFIPVTTGC